MMMMMTTILSRRGRLSPVVGIYHFLIDRNKSLLKDSKGNQYYFSSKIPKEKTPAKVPAELPANLYPPIRSISEARYMTSRGIQISHPSDAGPELKAFSEYLMSEGLTFSNWKSRTRYVRPCEKKRQALYASRKRKFNRLVGEKIREILAIHKNE